MTDQPTNKRGGDRSAAAARNGKRVGPRRQGAKRREVVSFTFDPDTTLRLDKARGAQSRSAYVEALVLAATEPLALIDIVEGELCQ